MPKEDRDFRLKNWECKVQSRFGKAVQLLSHPFFAKALMLNRIPAAIEHLRILDFLNPSHLIDIGANIGQFSVAAAAGRPKLKIDCFEPLGDCASRLEAWAKTIPNELRVHRFALDDNVSEKTFHRTSRSDSSSLLEPDEYQKDRGIEVVMTTSLVTARLDGILRPGALNRPSMMKIDVQGAELGVLRGAEKLLSAIDSIYVEVSFSKLYLGQSSFEEMRLFLERFGFLFRGVGNCYVDSRKGPEQADVLFLKI